VTQFEFAGFTPGQYSLHSLAFLAEGETLSVGGLQQKVLSAKMYPGGKTLKFDQQDFRVRISGLPAAPPDPLVTTIAVECDAEPTQDMQAIRINRKRENV
jgi:alpha-L-fucosidase